MDATPDLVPGPAFHLEGDGQWDVQDLPQEVLRGAKYMGEIKIEGYPSVIFEMPDGDQWAQKAPGTPSPKGDEASADAVRGASGSLWDIAVRMASGKVSKNKLEPGQVRAAMGMLEELTAAKKCMDRAVQHSRVLQAEGSFDWVIDTVESSRDQLSSVIPGIKDALSYITRMDMPDDE